MDVPALVSGQVLDILVKLGDEVSTGSPILTIGPGDGGVAPPPTLVEQQEPDVAASSTLEHALAPGGRGDAAARCGGGGAGARRGAARPVRPGAGLTGVHASPSVRRTARELGVDLTAVTGTGPKGRITKDDLLASLRGPGPAAPAAAAGTGTGIPEIPAQDFAQFGPVQTQPLSRIKKRSGPHLHRSWLNVPHVTHQDEADISVLDAYRKELDTAARADGYRVTLLAFLMKASVSGLKQFPEFNSSLSPEKDSLIVKSYYHLAVDAPRAWSSR